MKKDKKEWNKATAKAVEKAKKNLFCEEKRKGRRKRKKIGGFACVVLSLSLLFIISVGIGRGIQLGYRRVRNHIVASHRLQTVHIVGNKTMAKETILRLLQLPRPISLEEIDIHLCRRRLLACPQILTAQVERAYPNDLRLRIVERVPVLRLARSENGEIPLVADDGMVFLASKSTDWQNLPLLQGVSGVVGKPLEGISGLCQALRTAAELEEALVASWRVVTVDPSQHGPGWFEVQCPEIQHLRLRMDDLPQQLEELRYLLEDFRRKKANLHRPCGPDNSRKSLRQDGPSVDPDG